MKHAPAALVAAVLVALLVQDLVDLVTQPQRGGEAVAGVVQVPIVFTADR